MYKCITDPPPPLMSLLRKFLGVTWPSRPNSWKDTAPDGGGNWVEMGGWGYFTYFDVSGKCVTNQNSSVVSNRLISEEFRCEHKSAYKTTISYIGPTLVIYTFFDIFQVIILDLQLKLRQSHNTEAINWEFWSYMAKQRWYGNFRKLKWFLAMWLRLLQ